MWLFSSLIPGGVGFVLAALLGVGTAIGAALYVALQVGW